MSADGGFRAGQDHQVGVAGQGAAGLHELHFDGRLGHQGVQVVEVGDAREHRDRDPERGAGTSLGSAPDRHRVLRREPARGLEPGDDAETRQAGAAADDLDAGVEEPDVAAEAVDDVGPHPRPFGGRQQRHGADEACDDSAPVDVADQRDRHAGGLGEPHVGHVAVAQVDSPPDSRRPPPGPGRHPGPAARTIPGCAAAARP